MTKNAPQTSKPLPTPLAMSTASEPTPSPVPIRSSSPSKSSTDIPRRPYPPPTFPNPKLRLKVHDLSHPGVAIFFSNCNPSSALSDAVQTVLSTLYHPTKTTSSIPATRSVTLVLESMGGVAYTTGIELDDDHKEIHFSLSYIAEHISSDRYGQEITGVLVHEMVHAWQHNGSGTCPGGLIEGIADFVRLKAGLSPPHWKKKSGGKWNSGYEVTGYFLEWLEEQKGEGTVSRINAALGKGKYEEEAFWKGLFGTKVGELWGEYQGTLKDNEDDGNREVSDDRKKT